MDVADAIGSRSREDRIPAGSFSDPAASVGGKLLDVRTADGDAVNVIDTDTFEIVNNGLIVRRTFSIRRNVCSSNDRGDAVLDFVR